MASMWSWLLILGQQICLTNTNGKYFDYQGYLLESVIKFWNPYLLKVLSTDFYSIIDGWIEAGLVGENSRSLD